MTMTTRTGISFVSRGKEEPSTLPDRYDYHGAWKSKGVGYGTKQVFKNYTTSNSYEDSLVFDGRLSSRFLLHIKEIGGANAVKVNILACLDPQMWETILADKPIIAGQSYVESISQGWNYIKIQVASQVAGQAGRVNAFIGGKTP